VQVPAGAATLHLIADGVYVSCTKIGNAAGIAKATQIKCRISLQIALARVLDAPLAPGTRHSPLKPLIHKETLIFLVALARKLLLCRRGCSAMAG